MHTSADHSAMSCCITAVLWTSQVIYTASGDTAVSQYVISSDQEQNGTFLVPCSYNLIIVMDQDFLNLGLVNTYLLEDL